jgi:hypothetical protein
MKQKNDHLTRSEAGKESYLVLLLERRGNLAERSCEGDACEEETLAKRNCLRRGIACEEETLAKRIWKQE